VIVSGPATDPGGSGPPRPTIADVARAAGVSIAVASYALNGRSGLSTATRERVLRVADELGWRPSAAARSVRAGPRAVGLAVTGEPGTLARATAFLDFLTAAADGLRAAGLSLDVQVAASAEATADLYRTWRAERRFDVLVVPDLLTEDLRLDVLRWTRAPAVLLGPHGAVEGMAAVCLDEAGAGTGLAGYLVALGHERVAAVTAPLRVQATQVRLAALRGVVGARGGVLVHRETNATPEGAAAVTRVLLTEPAPPSAIVYDTDQMALAGLDVARRLGVEVPWELSIVAGCDSELCRLATPAVTALPMPMADLGAATARAVLALLRGEVDVAEVVPTGALAVRGSTGPRVGT